MFYVPTNVLFSEEEVKVSDILFVAKKNKCSITPKCAAGVSSLIGETLSTIKNRDRIDNNKKALYEKVGTKIRTIHR